MLYYLVVITGAFAVAKLLMNFISYLDKQGGKNMNEMMVSGYFYLKTDKKTNEEAFEDFRKACESVGIDTSNATAVIVRDEHGHDITRLKRM